MHVHILGICGTFMAGIARLAVEQGMTVTGSDAAAYPPMSDQLSSLGITVELGYDQTRFDPLPDMVVIGNALSRGNPAVEHVLNHRLPYCSGPEWLAQHVLLSRQVVAVSGTHGKTTTASMLAWILERAGMNPGFLIGGVPGRLEVSARLGDTESAGPFVVEADEYDSAFFDKRSKFVHYRPTILVINNIEFDHADIFSDLSDIQRQFHHLVRTVPGNGLIVHPDNDPNVQEMLAEGCWSETQGFGSKQSQWQARLIQPDGSHFEIRLDQQGVGEIQWQLLGRHNATNGLAAVAAAARLGVAPESSCVYLSRFVNAKRRMEKRGQERGVTVYDDFAHHPTAIRATLAALRLHVGDVRILAVLDLASNSMRMGVHRTTLGNALSEADEAFIHAPSDVEWNTTDIAKTFPGRVWYFSAVDSLLDQLLEHAEDGDHVLIMSNGGFGNIHQRLLDGLGERTERLYPRST